MRSYLTYWKPQNIDWDNPSSEVLDHTAGNQLKKVSRGDHLYLITYRDGVFYLLGRIEADGVVSQAQAARRLGRRPDELWEADYHVLASKPIMRAVAIPFTKTLQQLQLISGRTIGHLRGPNSVQRFRMVREITPASAAALDALLADVLLVGRPGLDIHGAQAIHRICMYAIRHGDALDEDWRSGGTFSFTERRSWSRAAKELAVARQNGCLLPIVFADARATRYLIFRAEIDDLRVSWSDGKAQTTVLANRLEKLANPPPKTQLVVADTGRHIPVGYIRSYVICRTPRWLYSEEVIPPDSPPDMLELPEPATEGRRKLVSHLIRERNRALIEQKKRAVLESAGYLACEVCGFDFRKRYGRLGDGFCEVHHRLPLSDTSLEVQTRLEDLAVLCANCHRMIHRGGEVRELSVVQAALTPNKPIETDDKSGRGLSA
jgi:hypothetical protein